MILACVSSQDLRWDEKHIDIKTRKKQLSSKAAQQLSYLLQVLEPTYTTAVVCSCSCMTQFTAGQRNRMWNAWDTYRQSAL
jgi:hypothetical protein